MHGSHETLDNAEVGVDDLGQRGEAIGGARGVGHNVGDAIIELVVNTHHEHGGVSGRGRDDNLLGSTRQVSRGLGDVSEHTGRLDDIDGAGISPLDGGRVALSEASDGVAVDDKLLVLDFDGALPLAVGGIVLEHVHHVVKVDKRVVDRNDLDALAHVGEGGNEETTDYTKKPDQPDYMMVPITIELENDGKQLTQSCVEIMDIIN